MKPKKPKRPLKSEPKPLSSVWVEYMILEKDDQLFFTPDFETFAKEHIDPSLYEDYVNSSGETDYQALVSEQEIYNVSRLNKTTSEFIVNTFSDRENYTIEFSCYEYFYISVLEKKPEEEYKQELLKWENRFSNYEIELKKYHQEMEVWEAQKNKMQLEEMKKKVALLEAQNYGLQ